MKGLVLSLFPGIGLLDRAFEEAGFCVVRGPDLLWGGDIHAFHPPVGRFDGVIGGPPCQQFSPLSKMVKHNGHDVAPNLIPEFERCVAESSPAWFLMENVGEAPCPSVEGYAVDSQLLNNRWCDDGSGIGAEQTRIRRFSFGVRGEVPMPLRVQYAPLDNAAHAPTVIASGIWIRRQEGSEHAGQLRKHNASAHSVAESIRLQGLPQDFLQDAPFTCSGKQKVIGNGVPLYMGRAIAAAVEQVLRGKA